MSFTGARIRHGAALTTDARRKQNGDPIAAGDRDRRIADAPLPRWIGPARLAATPADAIEGAAEPDGPMAKLGPPATLCTQVGRNTEPRPLITMIARNSGEMVMPTIPRKWMRPAGGASSSSASRALRQAARAASPPTRAMAAAAGGPPRSSTRRRERPRRARARCRGSGRTAARMPVTCCTAHATGRAEQRRPQQAGRAAQLMPATPASRRPRPRARRPRTSTARPRARRDPVVGQPAEQRGPAARGRAAARPPRGRGGRRAA